MDGAKGMTKWTRAFPTMVCDGATWNIDLLKDGRYFATLVRFNNNRDGAPELDEFAEMMLRAIGSHANLVAACRLALDRLLRLGAEDDLERVGRCPACEAIRAVLRRVCVSKGT